MNDSRTTGYSLAEVWLSFKDTLIKMFTHNFSLFTNSCFACYFFKSIASTKCKYSWVAIRNWCSGRGSSCAAVSVKESSFKWTGGIPGKSRGSYTRWPPVGESPALLALSPLHLLPDLPVQLDQRLEELQQHLKQGLEELQQHLEQGLEEL